MGLARGAGVPVNVEQTIRALWHRPAGDEALGRVAELDVWSAAYRAQRGLHPYIRAVEALEGNLARLYPYPDALAKACEGKDGRFRATVDWAYRERRRPKRNCGRTGPRGRRGRRGG